MWGFYAHREINRLAVYTLPDEVATLYKANINYVSQHAVDPDKRRYAASLEGARHFVDMERFGDGTMAALPLEFWAFHDRYTYLYCHHGSDSSEVSYFDGSLLIGQQRSELDTFAYRTWYQREVFPAYRYEKRELPGVLPKGATQNCDRLTLIDTMTQHGVLPYHLVDMQARLTQAFRIRDIDRVLQWSAEIGHYIGDATVPLHTTENYNGQLTGQRGIHSFWESRIPELFAEAEFDVLVGSAEYISDKAAFFRNLVHTSHQHVDSVLLIEADLRRKMPEDLQDCYEERLGRIVRVPCRDFTRAYFERLDGMVEERFRTAIRSVGSSWYTAWVDAGSPPMSGRIAEATVEADTLRVKDGLDGRGH